MASGRPVLMAVRGDGATFLERNQFGITAEPANPSSLAQAIIRLRDMPASAREEFGINGRNAFDLRYCSKVQIQRFEQLLQLATRSNGPGVASYVVPAGH
jgi:glycosyltransferase involved in cell wall biosynthesis